MNTSRNTLYYATAEAEAFTYLSTGEKVTSSASSTSTSSESYEEAYLLAETIANTVSQSVAENNANIIAQSLQLATQFHSTRNNLAYFTSQAQLSDFHIPSQNSYYNILTNFESYKQINPQTTENNGKTMCFDTTKRYIFMGSNSQGVNDNGNIPYCRITCFDTEKSVYIGLPTKILNAPPQEGLPPPSSILYPDYEVTALYFYNNFLFVGLNDASSVCTFAYTDCSFLYDNTKTKNELWNYSNSMNNVTNYFNIPIYTITVNNDILYIGGGGGDNGGSVFSANITHIPDTYITFGDLWDGGQGYIEALFINTDKQLYAFAKDRLYIYSSPSSPSPDSIPYPSVLSDPPNYITYDSDTSMLYLSAPNYCLFSFSITTNTFQEILTNVSSLLFANHRLIFCFTNINPLICYYNPDNGQFRTFSQNPNLSVNDSIQTILVKKDAIFTLLPTGQIFQTIPPSLLPKDSAPLLLENSSISIMPQAFQTTLQYNSTSEEWQCIS